jgi:hypothetical protein
MGEILAGLVLMVAVALWAKAQPQPIRFWAAPVFLLVFLGVTGGAGHAAEGLKEVGARPLGFDLGVTETALLLLFALLPVILFILRFFSS